VPSGWSGPCLRPLSPLTRCRRTCRRRWRRLESTNDFFIVCMLLPCFLRVSERSCFLTRLTKDPGLKTCVFCIVQRRSCQSTILGRGCGAADDPCLSEVGLSFDVINGRAPMEEKCGSSPSSLSATRVQLTSPFQFGIRLLFLNLPTVPDRVR
jgi:hypothetical protein